MTDRCSEESFLRMISITGQAMRNHVDQRLKKYELTVEQLQVMKQMTLQEGQTQSQLCRATDKNPANITRILDRLEKRGRIVRKKNPSDRRASLVFLTEDGQRLRDELYTLFHSLEAELVKGIDPQKQAFAIEVLKDIKEKIENISND